MNEILNIDPDFTGEIVLNGTEVSFPQYQSILDRVIKIRDYLSNVEVTEESLGNAKKLVATIRKEVEGLNRQRIDTKKIYLQPFELIEVQIKEISDIATEAENSIRSQTRRLEELERERKEEQIREIFEKRTKRLKHKDFIRFEDFIKPQHLNKSTSISKVENEMVQWLESIKTDIQIIHCGTIGTPEELLPIYFEECGLNLSKTLQTYSERQKVEEYYKEILEPKVEKKPEVKQEPACFIELKCSDLQIVKALLDKHQIYYREV